MYNNLVKLTLLPMQLKTALPTSQRRIIRANTNWRMSPQMMCRHTTYPAGQKRHFRKGAEGWKEKWRKGRIKAGTSM